MFFGGENGDVGERCDELIHCCFKNQLSSGFKVSIFAGMYLVAGESSAFTIAKKTMAAATTCPCAIRLRNSSEEFTSFVGSA